MCHAASGTVLSSRPPSTDTAQPSAQRTLLPFFSVGRRTTLRRRGQHAAHGRAAKARQDHPSAPPHLARHPTCAPSQREHGVVRLPAVGQTITVRIVERGRTPREEDARRQHASALAHQARERENKHSASAVPQTQRACRAVQRR